MSKLGKRPREASPPPPAAAPAPPAAGARPDPQLSRVARAAGVAPGQARAAASLLDAGNTLPFIARYRKEATGGLDDSQLRALAAQLAAVDRLEEQRSGVLSKLQKLGVLSEGLRTQVEAAETVQALEDLYLPHRPKRTTKASAARNKGLGPLADALLGGGKGGPGSPEAAARTFVRPPEVPTAAEALAGAQSILAERAAELPAARERARAELWERGSLVSQLSRSAKRAAQEAAGGSETAQGAAAGKQPKQQSSKSKAGGSKAGSGDADAYAMYHDFRCPVRAAQPHQVQAVSRGEAQGVLSINFQWQVAPVEEVCYRQLAEKGGAGPLPASYGEVVRAAVKDGVQRLLKPAIEREVRAALAEAAAEQAAQAFAHNLRQLLLQPPLPGVVVLGVDPAFRTGCKLAVCDTTGKVFGTGVVYPHPPAPEAQRALAAAQLAAFMKQHRVQAVAIGNGTASRETQRFVADTLAVAGLAERVGWCVVSEAGASVYSACELAGKELPGLDVSLRGAVSIARRLQDPLSELVKVPPESLGVGQYQQDLKAATLAGQLAGTVEWAVNEVGVDLNAASPALLTHVAGLNKATAAAIVARRDTAGPFQSRQQLLEVKGIGPRTFQQCAGFLRVRHGPELLDTTAVHPESYPPAEALVQEACGVDGSATQSEPSQKRRKKGAGGAAAACGAGGPPLTAAMLQRARPALRALLGAPQPEATSLGAGGTGSSIAHQQAGDGKRKSSSGGGGESWVSGERLAQLAARLGVGEPTLRDIAEALLAPDRDVRGQAGLASLQFKQALGLADLTPGMELSGIVRNVTSFGAFVDINAGQDGLVHLSELRKGAQRAGQAQRGGAPPDAYSLVAMGDLLRVRVLSVDAQRGRISLALASPG